MFAAHGSKSRYAVIAWDVDGTLVSPKIDSAILQANFSSGFLAAQTRELASRYPTIKLLSGVITAKGMIDGIVCLVADELSAVETLFYKSDDRGICAVKFAGEPGPVFDVSGRLMQVRTASAEIFSFMESVLIEFPDGTQQRVAVDKLFSTLMIVDGGPPDIIAKLDAGERITKEELDVCRQVSAENKRIAMQKLQQFFEIEHASHLLLIDDCPVVRTVVSASEIGMSGYSTIAAEGLAGSDLSICRANFLGLWDGTSRKLAEVLRASAKRLSIEARTLSLEGGPTSLPHESAVSTRVLDSPAAPFFAAVGGTGSDNIAAAVNTACQVKANISKSAYGVTPSGSD